MMTDLFLAVHCDGAMRRYERFGLSSRIETVILRRDQPQDPSATETRIIQGRCLSLRKLGLEWSYRHYPARQEWLPMESGQGLVNLSAKHMVYRTIKQNDRVRVHPIRNAGTVVVFDHEGSAIEPAKIQAINAYFQSISRPVDGNTAGHGIIQPSIQGFSDFWDQWEGNRSA